ncbi:MFS transporter [Salinispira pacifica]
MATRAISPRPRRQAFTALKYPNYRLWFQGQVVSLFGTWMQATAQGFLVFQLTRSAAYLGYVAFANGIAIWLFTLYGGAVADRIPRRTLLIVTQSFMMMLAFLLSALTFLRVVQPWHIILLSFFLGLANAFDAPARQSFVPELVDREDLTNAIALNSTMFNTAVALGPAAGGIVYAAIGPGWCFAVNGITFGAVILALVRMKLKPFVAPPLRKNGLASIAEGLRYIASQRLVLAIIALVSMVSMFGISFVTLFPVWAVKVLHGDATTNGLLQSARGIGAFAGAVFIASLGRFRFKGRLLTLGTFAFPGMMLLFSFTRILPAAMAMLVVTGLAQIMIMNLANALVQTQIADEMRGRVMSVYSLTFLGLMPVGALISGAIADHATAPFAVAFGAAVCLLAAFSLALFVPAVRRLQ